MSIVIEIECADAGESAVRVLRVNCQVSFLPDQVSYTADQEEGWNLPNDHSMVHPYIQVIEVTQKQTRS